MQDIILQQKFNFKMYRIFPELWAVDFKISESGTIIIKIDIPIFIYNAIKSLTIVVLEEWFVTVGLRLKAGANKETFLLKQNCIQDAKNVFEDFKNIFCFQVRRFCVFNICCVGLQRGNIWGTLKKHSICMFPDCFLVCVPKQHILKT